MKKIEVNIQEEPILPWINMIKDTEEEIEISVFDGKSPVDVSGMTAELKWRKPTRETMTINAEIEGENVITIASKEETDITGQTICELTLKKGKAEIKAYFYVYVEDIRQ